MCGTSLRVYSRDGPRLLASGLVTILPATFCVFQFGVARFVLVRTQKNLRSSVSQICFATGFQLSALDPDVLRKDALYPILDRLGIPRKKGASGFHTFRHSAASIVNEQTGNLKLAQKFLGHSTIKMTADIYTHTSAEAERDAAIALERAICGDLFPVVPNIENRNNFAAPN